MYVVVISFLRRFPILWRLLLSFGIVISIIAAGFTMAAGHLSDAASLLPSNVDGAAAPALQHIASARSAYWLALGLGAVSGSALILMIALSIVRPIAHLGVAAQRRGEGDLTQLFDTRFVDEVGTMAQVFNSVSRQMAMVVRDIQAGSGKVGGVAFFLSQHSNDLSERTDSSVARLPETAGTMEQINATVRQSAGYAEQASLLSKAAGDVARRGGEASSSSVETMTAISLSIEQMREFLAVIDRIAFQTNILAINASIEAAQAGSAGAGFSVVAAAVRTLATRSASAAEEVNLLIQRAVELAQRGSTQSQSAGVFMKDIISSIGTLAAQVQHIRRAANEQMNGIAAVTVAIGTLDAMNQQNAALVDDVVDTTEELKVQSRALAGAVSAFNVEPVAASRLSPRLLAR